MEVTAFTFGAALVVLGDPVYFFRFELREMIVVGTEQGDLISAAAKHGALWFVLLLTALWMWRRVPGLALPQILLVASSVQCAALSALQATAAYQTNYSDGEEGTMELHGRIASSLLVDGVVLAPKDVLYRLGRHTQNLSPQFWADADAISLALSSPNTQFFCVSLPSVGIGTLRNTLDESSVAGQLEKHYKRERIGTHTLYRRRPILSGDR